MKEVVLILNNIRSAHNVGALFRTAEGAGVSCAYLIGYTPAPVDRFGRPQKDIAKTALGAEGLIAWEKRARLAPLVKHLKKKGFTVVGLEQDTRAIDYRTFDSGEKVALILGNEVEGLSKAARTLCDTLIAIPMRGKKESLNVSAAGAVALYQLLQ